MEKACKICNKIFITKNITRLHCHSCQARINGRKSKSFNKENVINNPTSKIYWTSRGYSEDEAANEIRKQRKIKYLI